MKTNLLMLDLNHDYKSSYGVSSLSGYSGSPPNHSPSSSVYPSMIIKCGPLTGVYIHHPHSSSFRRKLSINRGGHLPVSTSWVSDRLVLYPFAQRKRRDSNPDSPNDNPKKELLLSLKCASRLLSN